MSGFAEYGQYDALGLAELVRRGEVTANELVDEAIMRIEAVNPQLNAVIHTMYEHARSLAAGRPAAGAFAGVPFLYKDLLALYQDHPLRGGSRALRDFVPDHDSELVRRFKASGVIAVGKTNTPEFGLVPYTEPELFGPTHNPWNPAHSPSGSSGGSAAAVAARIVPMASGGDGGGSIRAPASACGLFGLKPSRGRNPSGPNMAEYWHGAVAEHVLTRSVRDSAAMLDATCGPDTGAQYFAPAPLRPFSDEVGADPGRLRIAYTTRSLLGKRVHPDCIKGVNVTVELLAELGHDVVEASPSVDRERFNRAYLTMIASDIAADISEIGDLRGRAVGSHELELATRALRLLGQKTTASQLNCATRYLHRVSRRVQAFFSDHDVLLTPTLAEPPPLTGSARPTRVEAAVIGGLSKLRAFGIMQLIGVIDTVAARTFEFLAFTPLFNVTGQPAMSVPLHWNSSGLPIGMHFVARYTDEATLFRLAAQLETARPWAHRNPPVCAG
ncbi:MAG: amidase [Proteobacteria bacterium]|nr:amidase [Pseudomonadota bacterium]